MVVSRYRDGFIAGEWGSLQGVMNYSALSQTPAGGPGRSSGGGAATGTGPPTPPAATPPPPTSRPRPTTAVRSRPEAQAVGAGQEWSRSGYYLRQSSPHTPPLPPSAS